MTEHSSEAPPTYFRLSEASWAEIGEAYRNGATAKELSALWKVSPGSIYRHAQVEGWTKKRHADDVARAHVAARRAEADAGRRPHGPPWCSPAARQRSLSTGVSGVGAPIPTASWRDSPNRGRTSQAPRLEGNRARDLRQLSELKALGWSALILWDSGLKTKAFPENEIRTFSYA